MSKKDTKKDDKISKDTEPRPHIKGVSCWCIPDVNIKKDWNQLKRVIFTQEVIHKNGEVDLLPQ